jgi:hypothetical protein
MSAAPDWDLDGLLARKTVLAAEHSHTPEFASRLRNLRAWQAGRLARTYRDLSRDPRYAAAIEFFLSDVYGPQDFTARDRELARAWRLFKRSLPAAALETLANAIELEVLTTELDHAMVAVLPPRGLDETEYARAYRQVARRDARERQIDLVVGIGGSLRRLVRRRWIGIALRAAHGPARAAGFGALQDFLERGYRAFTGLADAGTLLVTIRRRETGLMEALLSNRDDPFALAATPKECDHA